MLTDEIKKKIEKILERTCGLECSNGAENNKPALPELLSLYTEMVEEELKQFIKYCKEKENHTSTLGNVKSIWDIEIVYLKKYLTQRKETLPVEKNK